MPAPGDQLGDGLGCGGDPLGAQPRREQPRRLIVIKRAQPQRPGSFGGGEPGQRGPAGHDGQAPRAAGQQRPHLRGVTGVIQNDQHPPPGQHAAVQPEPRWRLRRDLRRGHPQSGPGTSPPPLLASPPGPGHSRAGSHTAARPGNRPAALRAQCTASAVLPTPAIPATAEITTAPAGPPSPSSPSSGPTWSSRASSSLSSASRPAKNPVPAGSCRGTTPGAALHPGQHGRARGRRGGLRSHGRQHLRYRGPTAGRRHEQGGRRLSQAQRARQQRGGVLAGRWVDAPLQVTDRPRGKARRLRQLLLGQPRLGPQLPQQPREPQSRLFRHRPNPSDLACARRPARQDPRSSLRTPRHPSHHHWPAQPGKLRFGDTRPRGPASARRVPRSRPRLATVVTAASRPGRPIDSCGSSCGPSRMADTSAAGDGGTSRATSPLGSSAAGIRQASRQPWPRRQADAQTT